MRGGGGARGVPDVGAASEREIAADGVNKNAGRKQENYANDGRRQRTARSQSALETLFVLMAMGEDRAVHSTYVAGRLAHARDGVMEAAR